MKELKINPSVGRLLIKIKSSKTLFILWYKLYGRFHNNIRNWFNHETVFYIDGYPRSGNTFTHMLIKNVFGDVRHVHRFHYTGALKIAVNKKIPNFILYRNPKQAIASNYLKEYAMIFETNKIDCKRINVRLLNHCIEQYIHYYQFVIRNQNHVRLLSFEKLIDQPQEILWEINKIVPNRYKKNQAEINNLIKKHINAPLIEENAFMSSRPNPTKEKCKKELYKSLNKLKKLEIANRLYREMVSIQAGSNN